MDFSFWLSDCPKIWFQFYFRKWTPLQVLKVFYHQGQRLLTETKYWDNRTIRSIKLTYRCPVLPRRLENWIFLVSRASLYPYLTQNIKVCPGIVFLGILGKMIKAQPSFGGPRSRLNGGIPGCPGGLGGLGHCFEHHNLFDWHRYFVIGPPSGGLSGGLFAIISTAKTRIKMFRIMSTNYVWISMLNVRYQMYPISK